jgi:hypothetical protein
MPLLEDEKMNGSFTQDAILLFPGTRVRHPEQPEWGNGQVQSVIGNRITVNFENVGKQLILGDRINLVVIEEEA